MNYKYLQVVIFRVQRHIQSERIIEDYPLYRKGYINWRVRVKDGVGNWSDWSSYRTFEIHR